VAPTPSRTIALGRAVVSAAELLDRRRTVLYIVNDHNEALETRESGEHRCSMLVSRRRDQSD